MNHPIRKEASFDIHQDSALRAPQGSCDVCQQMRDDSKIRTHQDNRVLVQYHPY